MSDLSAVEIDNVLDLIFIDDAKKYSFARNKISPNHINVKPRIINGEMPNYTDLLQDRHLFKEKIPGQKWRSASWIRSHFRQNNMITLLFFGILVISIISLATSCTFTLWIWGWFPACQLDTRTEFYDIQILGKLSDNNLLHADSTKKTKEGALSDTVSQNFIKNRVEYSSSKQLSHYFNIELFKNLVLLYSLILAFVRWHLTNLQSGMSEIFERKRSVNNFIIANKSDVEDLISGALKFTNDPRHLQVDGPISRKKCADIIRECAEKSPYGAKGPSFSQKMFVYIELDNLELALKKYKDGYLDSEQMYRACEIFESRCISNYFRYIALQQGLRNYTRGFHKLLIVLLIFGYHKQSEADAKIEQKSIIS